MAPRCWAKNSTSSGAERSKATPCTPRAARAPHIRPWVPRGLHAVPLAARAPAGREAALGWGRRRADSSGTPSEHHRVRGLLRSSVRCRMHIARVPHGGAVTAPAGRDLAPAKSWCSLALIYVRVSLPLLSIRFMQRKPRVSGRVHLTTPGPRRLGRGPAASARRPQRSLPASRGTTVRQTADRQRPHACTAGPAPRGPGGPCQRKAIMRP
mmetsp:Transcript_11653/g.39815  ORF Transcript_11653/g.39815 Transcript_11653/m.39815 type:complete len:211 (+) Transcript_11653:854-1486(+)